MKRSHHCPDSASLPRVPAPSCPSTEQGVRTAPQSPQGLCGQQWHPALRPEQALWPYMTGPLSADEAAPLRRGVLCSFSPSACFACFAGEWCTLEKIFFPVCAGGTSPPQGNPAEITQWDLTWLLCTSPASEARSVLRSPLANFVLFFLKAVTRFLFPWVACLSIWIPFNLENPPKYLT